MPMPAQLRDLLKTLYDQAESAEDKQAVTRVTVLGAVYKVLINLGQFPEEIIVRIKKRSG